jgi:hypothetical protein
MEIKKIDKTFSNNYHKRAMEFFHAMKEEKGNNRHNASALLGIHASIALADSITIHERGERASDRNHKDSIKLITSVCRKLKIDNKGAKRLSRILHPKSKIAYGRKFDDYESDGIKNILLNVDRLFTWAYENFQFLNPERTGGMNAK